MSRWLPPKFWQEDDGCSGVPDFGYRAACRRHDWRYRRVGRWSGLTGRQTRRLADICLRYDMQNLNREVVWYWQWVWWPIPWVWYIGVRVAGWKHFREDA